VVFNNVQGIGRKIIQSPKVQQISQAPMFIRPLFAVLFFVILSSSVAIAQSSAPEDQSEPAASDVVEQSQPDATSQDDGTTTPPAEKSEEADEVAQPAEDSESEGRTEEEEETAGQEEQEEAEANGDTPLVAEPKGNGSEPTEEEGIKPPSPEAAEAHKRVAELGRKEIQDEVHTDLDPKLFPTSPIIEAQKAFWIRVFSEVSSRQGFIHNGWLSQPIYEKVDLEGMSRKQQRRYVKNRKKAIVAGLRKLANDLEKGETLDAEGQKLLALFPKDITPKALRKNAQEVRFQRGLANRFVEGLKTSGAVLAKIKTILSEHGVPKDLAYLPHVESSFNLRAYSKYGAAGIWQFTRSTGKRFLTIKYEVDERLDPLLATVAAARFLKRNHERLESWPLAITGYNHGPLGIKRLVDKFGTRDLSHFIENFHGRTFKFASKNFYAEFLAAREVATHYKKYFGEVEMDPPLNFATVELPFYMELALVSDMLSVDSRELRRLNPSLRNPVFVGTKYIPKGYELRLPPSTHPEKFLASVPNDQQYKRQKLTEVVRVERGDTLYGLGRRYGVPWTVIAEANHITKFHRLRPGQRLVIPRRGKDRQWVAANVPVPKPKVLRTVAVKEREKIQPNGKPDVMPLPEASIAFQKAEGSMLFQDLGLKNFNSKRNTAQLIAAYGETLGHYANWATVSTQTIRNANGMRFGEKLQPGVILVMPLSNTTEERFSQARVEFHQSREEDFFSTYAVAEVSKIKVRRGDSIWSLTQSNNIPMWLFYQQNPDLINTPIRRGMTVSLPVIEELVELAPGTNGATPAPAGQ